MLFRKIAGPMRIDSTAGGGQKDYELMSSSGGREHKTANYMVKILGLSGANAKVGLSLNHGPDGKVSVAHSTPIAVAVPSTAPSVMSGDADTTKVLGEYLHPVVSCASTGATAEWAIV